MGKHVFLSDDWIEAARAVQDEFRGRATPGENAIRMNQVVTELPFPPGTMESHLDTSKGDFDLDVGFLEDPDVTITVPYETAKAIFVDANPQAAMQAFLEGRLTVDGDLAKLMVFQTAATDPVMLEAQARIREITA